MWRSALEPQANAGGSHWSTTLEPHIGAPHWNPTLEHHTGAPHWSTTLQPHTGAPHWSPTAEHHNGRWCQHWKPPLELHSRTLEKPGWSPHGAAHCTETLGHRGIGAFRDIYITQLSPQRRLTKQWSPQKGARFEEGLHYAVEPTSKFCPTVESIAKSTAERILHWKSKLEHQIGAARTAHWNLTEEPHIGANTGVSQSRPTLERHTGAAPWSTTLGPHTGAPPWSKTTGIIILEILICSLHLSHNDTSPHAPINWS